MVPLVLATGTWALWRELKGKGIELPTRQAGDCTAGYGR